jgi:hypothetical protein
MTDDDTLRTVYELVQLMSSLNETRRAILLALSHVHPRSVSGVQLSRLIGYSGKSRSLYRGVLTHMQEDGMISIDELTPRLHAIRVTIEHPLLSMLVELCRKYGKDSLQIYTKALEE